MAKRQKWTVIWPPGEQCGARLLGLTVKSEGEAIARAEEVTKRGWNDLSADGWRTVRFD